jgi:hypothetical protein
MQDDESDRIVCGLIHSSKIGLYEGMGSCYQTLIENQLPVRSLNRNPIDLDHPARESPCIQTSKESRNVSADHGLGSTPAVYNLLDAPGTTGLAADSASLRLSFASPVLIMQAVHHIMGPETRAAGGCFHALPTLARTALYWQVRL